MDKELNQEVYDTEKDTKPIFSIKSTLTLESYLWAVKVNARKVKPILIIVVIFLLGIALLVFLGRREETFAILCLALSSLVFVERWIVLPMRVKKVFRRLSENNETENQYDLYEKHIVKTNPVERSVIKYNQIYWVNESSKYIAFYINLNKVLILDKNEYDAEAIEFIRSRMNQDAVEKYKIKIVAKNIIIWLLTVFIVCCCAFFIWAEKPINKYPYSTYESFVGCLDAGYIDEVTIHGTPFKETTITYRYINQQSEKEYYNTIPPKDYDQEELLDMIQKRNVTFKQ